MNYSKRKKIPATKETRIRNIFCLNLISYRKAFNLKQRELAIILDVELHNIQAYEERRSIPSVIHLLGIVEILGVTIEELFTKEINWNNENIKQGN